MKSHFKWCQFCISYPCVKQWSEGMFTFEYLIPGYVSYPATLRKFSTHIREPVCQVSSHFDMFCLGFEPLKVGQLPLLLICMFSIILGSPVWQAINLDQLTQMINFLFHHFLGVRYFVRSRFELMTNPFDPFSNAIPNAIYKFLMFPEDADYLSALFVML